MVKNKRKHPGLDEVLDRPWCYYCERDFDDLKILISHQKAKHYKCDRCGRRLNTAGGLSVHMTQVHKETLTMIENALPNRAGLEVEIFGMEGIPEDVNQSHRQRVIQGFAQAEADRRASTGNPGPGGEGGVKKPKIEEVSDLKKRLAEHKAKKAAEEAEKAAGGGMTPVGAGEQTQTPNTYAAAASPSYAQPPYAGPPNGQFQGQSPAYGQQPPFPQQASPPAFSPFSPPGMQQPYPNNQAFAPPQQYGPGPPNQGPPQFQAGPPNQGPPQFQTGPPVFQNGPPPQFQGGPPQFQQGPPQFQGGPPPHFQNGAPMQFAPPQHFGPGSPGPFPQQQFQSPRNNTPPQNPAIPQRPPSLPPAPGLPQRPVVNAPQVNYQQMQQMHQGQFPGSPSNVPPGAVASPGSPPSAAAPTASSLDELVSGAAKDADKAAEAKTEAAAATPAAEGKKKDRKDSKGMKLIYSDNETSPEEKLARMPRYAFSPAVTA